MKTIAQQLNVTDFPFEIRDKEDNQIYSEDSYGNWVKNEYDSKGNQTYLENSGGSWVKWEYDSEGNEIYYENSNGNIRDKRPKETITVNGIKYQRIGE